LFRLEVQLPVWVGSKAGITLLSQNGCPVVVEISSSSFLNSASTWLWNKMCEELWEPLTSTSESRAVSASGVTIAPAVDGDEPADEALTSVVDDEREEVVAVVDNVEMEDGDPFAGVDDVEDAVDTTVLDRGRGDVAGAVDDSEGFPVIPVVEESDVEFACRFA